MAEIFPLCALALIVNVCPAASATYYVDGASSSATDSGPGTSVQPFRTVQAAVTAFGAAGNTIVVRPATYREQATIGASGTSTSPIVLEAEGPAVVMTGSDDLSGTAKWSAFSGSVFLASSVTWAPLQVFADGARLTPSTAPPASLPPNAFVHVMGSGLYVNVGGANPGSRRLEVGRRASGFRVSGSYVTVSGFQIMNTESDGVEVISVTGSTIRNCRVSFANQQGIHVSGGTSVLVLRNTLSDNNDHGIYVTTGTGCRIAENESFLNARPAVRAANGIYVNGSTNCTVEANRCHDNQDSGIQFYNGANNSTSRNNVSWNNGDHGFDHVRSSGVRHSNDVAYGNSRDGFSFEGDSPGGALFNCIAVDNGLTSNEFDLWIDATSMPGFQSNDNIIWNSTSQAVVKYGATPYTSVASFSSVSGTDTRTTQRNPLFTNPGTGIFTLSQGSPAIDNANAGAAVWPGKDAAGVTPFDDPGTPNAGIGTSAFADRGAYEFTIVSIPDQAPVVTAAATATVTEGAMLTIASSVADPDGDPITSLTADLSRLPAGHNAVFTPNASRTGGTLTWTPTYADGRAAPYPVTFTATNALSGTASTSITVSNLDRAPVVTVPASAIAIPSTPFSLGVTAADLDGDAISSLTADLTGLPAGHNAVFTPNATRTAGTLTWTPQANDGAGPYTVRFTAANTLSATAVTSLRVDRKPVVTAPATATIGETSLLTVNVTASDPDGNAITSLTANLTGLPAGHNAAFTPNATKTAGTLTWTPTYADGRAAPYTVTFTATNAQSGTASTSIAVANVDRAPVVSAPTSATAIESSPFTMNITASDPDGDAVTSLTADLTGLPAGHNAVFTPNATRTAGTLTWTPRPTDGAGPYTVRFTATNTRSATAATSLRIDRKPVVTAPATATVGETSTLTVNVSASDPDGNAITSLTTNLTGLPAGHNAVFTPNASSTGGTLMWTPTYADGRAAPYTVTFTATNAQSGTASTSITVANVDRAPVVTAPASATAIPSTPFSLSVTAADVDGDAIASLTADLTGLPAGHNAVFTPNASRTAGTLTWTPQSTDGAGPYTVRFTAANALSAAAVTSLRIDLEPVVTAPATVTATEASMLTVNITASDPDGSALTSLAADLSGLPPGNNAAFTVNAARTQGTFTWTPSASDSRGTPYVITFTAANALSTTISTSITVNNVDRAPAVTATGTLAGVEGVRALIAVTALDPDGDAVTSLTADLAGLPASSNAVFSVNASKTIGTLAWTPTYTDGRIAPYTVTFRAANAQSRTAVSSITVRDTPAPGTELAKNSGFESNVQGWTEVGRAALTRANSGRSGSYSAQLAATTGNKSAFSISDAPSAVDFVPTAGSTYRINAWVRSSSDNGIVKLEVAEMVGGSQQGATALSGGIGLGPVWAPVTFDYVARLSGSILDVEIANAPVSGHENFQIDDVSIKQISNGPADRPPVVTAFAGALVAEGGTLSMSVLASDLDGQPITSFVADFSALPASHDAVFTTNAAKTLGTLTWTPTRFDSRGTPYVVMFTAANVLSGAAAIAITVQDVAGEPGPANTTPAVGLVPRMAEDIAAGVERSSHGDDGAIVLEEAKRAVADSVVTAAVGTGSGLEPNASEALRGNESGAAFASHVVGAPGGAIDLEFSNPTPGRVTLEIFDVRGRRVGRNFDEFLQAGVHRIGLREPGGSTQMPSGIYFYRIETAGIRRSGRFAVVL